jgi:hypothetical protein
MRIVAVAVSGSVAFLAPAANAADEAITDNPLVAAAVNAIRAQEQSVKELTASGIYKQTSWDLKRKAWVPNGEWDFTVICEGIPGGKRRLECHRSLAPWIGGPSPFAIDVSTVVYDGRLTAALVNKQGDFTNPITTPQLEITGSPPNAVSAYVASAWIYSIFGNKDGLILNKNNPPQRFSRFLLDAQRLGGFRVQDTTEGTHNLLKVTVADRSSMSENYYLDRDKGYSIYKYERTINGTTAPTSTIEVKASLQWEVLEFAEPIPHVFYPKIVEQDILKTSGGDTVMHAKGAATLSNIVINDNAVTDDTYKLEIPKNTKLIDPVTGIMNTIGGSPEQQKKAIEDAVKNAEESSKSDLPDKGPATQPGKHDFPIRGI